MFSLKIRRFLFKAFIYICAMLLLFYLVAPVFWLVISSISPERELISTPFNWLPEKPTFERFRGLIFFWEKGIADSGQKFRRAFANSLIITVVATALTMVFGTLAAYSYARFDFRGRKQLIIGILLTQMLPRASIIIPLYIFMGAFNLRDTRLGLIIVYGGFLVPIVIWILRNYFISIPVEIEEAAIVDGATTFQILYKIMVPMVTPAIFATGLYCFITAWNEFFFALILTGLNSKTVPVAVTEFSTQGGIDYGMMTAAGVIGMVVPIFVAFIFRDYITQGLTAGWSK
ncbi:MAG: carbohydrate ABC transporter permease [Bacillota bacterium]